jgi:hypothetical protein
VAILWPSLFAAYVAAHFLPDWWRARSECGSALSMDFHVTNWPAVLALFFAPPLSFLSVWALARRRKSSAT